MQMQNGAATFENTLAVTQKLKQSYYMIFAIVLLGIYTPKKTEETCGHKNLYINVHCSIFHNGQKSRNNPNVQQLMNKRVVHAYEILFGHNKHQLTHATK